MTSYIEGAMNNVSGDSNRIFISPALGCVCHCQYCYLPSLGLPTASDGLNNVGKNEIIYKAQQCGFIGGREGTIVSFGCYTEAWADDLKIVTGDCIKHFLRLGNPVQLATKQIVSSVDVEDLLPEIKWHGQLTFYLSCPTISFSSTLEVNVPPPIIRLKALKLQEKFHIPFYIYIKPFLKSVTDQFANLMKKYRVGAVVGSAFDTAETKVPAPVGCGRLYSSTSDEESMFINSLKQQGRVVFLTSVEPVELWRRNAV
jgi:DNA repair photolyase